MMGLFRRPVNTQITSDQYVTTHVPMSVDPKQWYVAIAVCEVFGVRFRDIVGIRDCQEKIVACHLEFMLGECTSLREVAKKYNINPDYMMLRISQLQDDVRKDIVLRTKITELRDYINEKSN